MMTREELLKYIVDNDLAEALDDAVHEGKGGEAAVINNGGPESQMEYLLDGVVSLADIESMVKDEAKRRADADAQRERGGQ